MNGYSGELTNANGEILWE
ncbi:hypothetical protein GYY69_04415 [Gilliamella sp. ESL0250]|nr:hypothetical protein [Gilliamella sp. ESL0250]